MGKLHELLAVEADRKRASERLVGETMKTFKKENLFSGFVKHTEMFAEDEPQIADEHLKIETTVMENLGYSLSALIKYWDTVAQKDATNSTAKADVVIDGKTILRDVTGTTLLGMEKKLNDLGNVLNAIPVLPSGIEWELDPTHEKGQVYKAKHNLETFKTQKDIDFREVSPATKEHPAQVAQVSVTNTTGRIVTQKWSGMITPYEKARLLANREKLLGAVKKARQRANDNKTVDVKIGDTLISYIINN